MYDFNECKNTSSVKSKIREIAFSNMIDAFIDIYGEENVSVVGNCEIAVCAGTRTLADGTEGEVCFTVKPVAKDFDVRHVVTSGKTFQPYERIKEADAYEVDKTKKEAEAEQKAKEKAEQRKRDEEARKKKKQKKEQGG